MPVVTGLFLTKPVTEADLAEYLRLHDDTKYVDDKVIQAVASCFFFGNGAAYSYSREGAIIDAVHTAALALAGVK